MSLADEVDGAPTAVPAVATADLPAALDPRTAQEMCAADRRVRARAMASMLARLHATPVPTSDERVSTAQSEERSLRPDDGLDAIFDEFGRTLLQLRVVNSLVLDFVRV